MQFSNSSFLFYGFLGLERYEDLGEMAAIGIIRYNVQCLVDERRYQGSNFVWGIEGENLTVTTTPEGKVVLTETIQIEQPVEGAVTEPDESVDEDDGTPGWIQATFLISFAFNFVCIALILCCCVCKRKNKMD